MDEVLPTLLAGLAGLVGVLAGRALSPITEAVQKQIVADSEIGPPLNWRYVELVTSFLFALIVWVYGPSLQAALLCLFGAGIVALCAVDLRSMLLPDAITLPLLATGLAVSATAWGFVDFTNALIGAFAGYLSLWGIARAYLAVTGEEGLGGGDMKLMAAIGSWLGWQALSFSLAIASVTAGFFGAWVQRRITPMSPMGDDRYFAFGPYLGAGALAYVLCPFIHEYTKQI